MRKICEKALERVKLLKSLPTGTMTIDKIAESIGLSISGARNLLNKYNLPYIKRGTWGGGENDTLCWKCKNTKCDWSRKFKPVENWQAEKVRVKIQNNTEVDSYIVRSCPEFTTQQKAIKYSYGHKDLSEAIVIKALRDYKYLTDNQLDEAFICKDNSKISKNEIKTFLKSEIGQLTLHIMNLENSVNRLLGE